MIHKITDNIYYLAISMSLNFGLSSYKTRFVRSDSVYIRLLTQTTLPSYLYLTSINEVSNLIKIKNKFCGFQTARAFSSDNPIIFSASGFLTQVSTKNQLRLGLERLGQNLGQISLTYNSQRSENPGMTLIQIILNI